ncbi:MAG: hypothetical protein RMK18_09505 [Armatimonadota bacterium]|nr:hypothetical protein [Armatimonadota bacterium]
MAYLARCDGKCSIVVDGEEIGEYDEIVHEDNLVFDSQNRLCAFAIRGIEFFLVKVEDVEE